MPRRADSKIAEVLLKSEREILSDWMERQRGALTLRRELLSDAALQAQSANFWTSSAPQHKSTSVGTRQLRPGATWVIS